MWIIKCRLDGTTVYWTARGNWSRNKSDASILNTKNGLSLLYGEEWEEVPNKVVYWDEEEAVFE